jgi:TatD DNase family protein
VRLIDTHAHLSDIPEVDVVLGRARDAGVSAIFAMGTSLETCRRTLQLADEYPGFVIPSVGIHPTEFFKGDVEEALAFVSEHAGQCLSVGEIGLDYWSKPIRKDKALKEAQREVYVRQLAIVAREGLPASIHGRGAWRDSLDLASDAGVGRAVFHWYSGPLDVLSDLLDSGYYISCTPALSGSPEQKAAVERAPLERILVETDSPVYLRGLDRPSEPADVTETVRLLAEAKGLPAEDVAEAATRNAAELFRFGG